MKNLKKYVVFAALLAAGVSVLSSCSKSSSGPATTASVMFVHGCAAGAANINLDAEVNNAKVAGATNIPFLSNSGYQQVTAASSLSLSFFVTGLNQLAVQTESITAGSHYTAFASGSITSPGICFTADDLTAPASGMAKVRFVNLSPDNLVANCFVGTSAIDSGLAYGVCSPYFQVSATTGKISMYDQVVPAKSAVIASQQLVAGKIYTFMLTGTSTGSGTSQYTLTAINNN